MSQAPLFSPLKIGKLELQNRIIKSAAGSYSIDAGINDQAMMFYENIAKGGAGMVWFEDLQFYDYKAEDVKRIVDRVHSYNIPIGIQTYGMWQFASSSKHMLSPLEMDMEDFRHREQTTEEVHAVQDAIIGNVKFAVECGFDAIELNCSSDHMFDTFLSKFWNISRTDQYSAESLENRARVVTEIIRRIKEECGSDFPVQVLFNGVEENFLPLGDSSLCITPEEAQEFAKLFEEAGADSLHIRTSSFGNHCSGFMPDVMHFGEKGNTGLGGVVDYNVHFKGLVDGDHDGATAFLNVAAKIKEAVSIPVGTVGNMDPRLAEERINEAIADGKIDFIMVNRPLLADPELPNKLKEGRKDDIVPCNKCVSCFKAVADMWGIGYCRVNPAYIRGGTEEMPEGRKPIPAETPKRVLVIGGGPAGMEAAAVAAQRGHQVMLYEKNQSLGGLIPLASAVKGKHDRMYEYSEFLQRRLDKLGVEIHLGETVDEAKVREIDPDAVLVAVGSSKPKTALTDHEGSNIYKDITLDFNKLGKEICIIGGDIIAYDYAAKLAGVGKKVTVISQRPEEEIGIEQSSWERAVVNGWMQAKGARFLGKAEIKEIGDSEVVVVQPESPEEKIKFDALFLLEDRQPNTELVEALKDYNAVAIGDCERPFNILEAVKSGNLAARRV